MSSLKCISAIAVASSRRWTQHFLRNKERGPDQPWTRGAGLTHNERQIVIASIQQFQLGESGEGRHLKKCAVAHGKKIGDIGYLEAIHLFVAEEQRHSAMLGQYLDLADAPRLVESKIDGIFRWLRHLMGIELSLIVLSTAEIVATVYYRALRDATGCPLLQSICKKILRDEAAHLSFHRQRFQILRQRRSFAMRSALRLFHHTLLMAALLPVWWCHGAVFRAAGMGFTKVAFDAHRRLHQDLRRIGLRARLRRALDAVLPVPDLVVQRSD